MRRRNVTVLLALLLAGAGLARAQDKETTGVIQGRIVDPQGLAVAGATLTATGTQGAKTATTDRGGRFNIPFLTPGTYGLRAQVRGFTAVEQKDIDVRLGQTIDLTLKMEVGRVTETAQVTASSPVIDTATTTVGARLDSVMLSRLPVGRGLADVIYVVPGVSSGGGTGNANSSMAGGTGLENQYVVDGVNITSVGYGALGSYASGTVGALGTGVTYDFIKEVQVKTGGYEAEYGQATGGVVNVITKSGSNNFHGTLFGYTRPSKLESDYTQIKTVNGYVNRTGSQLSDGGAEVGGPLAKDHVFFFGAIDPQWTSTSFIAPEGFPLRSLGSQDRKRKFVSYATKGTVQVTPSHRLDVSVFGDPGSGESGPQRSSSLRGATTAGFSKLDRFGNHNQVVKYDGVLNASWLVEALWARAKNTTAELPTVDTWQITDSTTVPQGRFGGLGFFANNEGINKQYQAKGTNIFGGHQIRYGVQYEDISYDEIRGYSGPTFTLPNGQKTVTGATVTILPDPVFGKIYRATRANYSPSRHTTQQYTNFFVQDSWKVGGRLTIRPGIRYEQQKLVGTLADFTWDKNWAPRVGATYDPAGTGKAKIFGNWGRFYAKVPNDLAVRSLSADAGISRADYFDANLTQPIPSTVSAAGTTRHFILAGTVAADFDPTSKSTYLDESLVGFEYEAAPGLNVGVRYIHRTMPRILEDIGSASMILYENGLPAPYAQYTSQLDSVEYFITNPRAGYPATLGNVGAFEDPIHKYDAVEFTADKRFSENWSLQASYRWSRLFGTFEGFYRNDNGQSDPAISSLFDFPTNDLTYTQIGVPLYGYKGDIRFLGALGAGPLPNDRPHQLKILGTYNLPRGLNLGTRIDLGSGKPLTELVANPNYASGGEIPAGKRGSGIQTVNGFKTRTPFEATLDIHVDYALKFGTERLVLLVDVFNLGNLQRVIDYNNWRENSFAVPNPDYGAIGGPVTGSNYQIPQQIRLGARFEF